MAEEGNGDNGLYGIGSGNPNSDLNPDRFIIRNGLLNPSTIGSPNDNGPSD